MSVKRVVVFVVIIMVININLSEVTSSKVNGTSDKITISKCCPPGSVFNESVDCIDSPDWFHSDFSEVDVYTSKIVKTGKNVKDFFLLRNFTHTGGIYSDTENWYITENGDLVLKSESPTSVTRWQSVKKENFCLEYYIDEDRGSHLMITFFSDKSESDQVKYFIRAGCLLTSSFFLVIVLVVYALLPKLRTLGVKIVMACAASFLGAYTLLASMSLLTLLVPVDRQFCVSFSALTYFFFMAAFCWMNVMSYDVWWSFRGFAKVRPIHRRGENFKYLIYSIYGWGAPLCLLLMFVLMNEYPIPGVISPSIPIFGCFIAVEEQRLYYHIPMAILLLSNCVFFLMTIFNIWRVNNSTKQALRLSAGTSEGHRASRDMFIIYLKISLVMGVSFILELLSSLAPEYAIWHVTDLYNIFIGVAFFLIFICKRKVLRLLRERFRREPDATRECDTSLTYISNSKGNRKISTYSESQF